jgi:hypothetical protein
LLILKGGTEEEEEEGHDWNEDSVEQRRDEELRAKRISLGTLLVYWGKHKHTGVAGNFSCFNYFFFCSPRERQRIASTMALVWKYLPPSPMPQRVSHHPPVKAPRYGLLQFAVDSKEEIYDLHWRIVNY